MDVTGWLKGNTHTHTVRSDGDATVEHAAGFYADRGYDFLAITDHNRYLCGNELSAEQANSPLLLLGGCEFSCKSATTLKPIDVCSIGGSAEPMPDPRVVLGGTPAETVRAAVTAARDAAGLPIVCHPCWRWALSAGDLLTIDGDFLLEVWNPSSDCNSYGGGGTDSPEEIWGRLLTAGRRVWAVAADDSHKLAAPKIPPVDIGGVAWVRVGAACRSPEAILAALAEGRFYSSTGVELAELELGPHRLAVRVQPVRDRRYTIHIIGPNNRELATVFDIETIWQPTGGEPFVRVRIEDTEGGRCWTQPWFVG